jgi:hypothetical protein
METTTAQSTELSKIVTDFFEISNAEEHCEHLTEMFAGYIESDGFGIIDKNERSSHFNTFKQVLKLINELSKVNAELEREIA